jgi:hypothetical protein
MTRKIRPGVLLLTDRLGRPWENLDTRKGRPGAAFITRYLISPDFDPQAFFQIKKSRVIFSIDF